MKVLDIPSSGKRGLLVAYQIRYGLYHRQYLVPANTQTPARQLMRRAFGEFARAWGRTLTQAQRNLWDQAGPKVRSGTRLGSGPLTGQRLFQGINSARACIGLPPFWEPPAPVIFGPNPVGQLVITNDENGIRLLVRVAAPTTVDIMVFGQAPCSAGRRKRRNVSYLGRLPAAQNGLSDITAMYIAPFGAPRPHERIFIVTRQQKDGWESHDQETSEVVPPKPLGTQAMGGMGRMGENEAAPTPPASQAAVATRVSPSPVLMHTGCTRGAQGGSGTQTLDIRERSEGGSPVKNAAAVPLGGAKAGPEDGSPAGQAASSRQESARTTALGGFGHGGCGFGFGLGLGLLSPKPGIHLRGLVGVDFMEILVRLGQLRLVHKQRAESVAGA
jgi:hypothetical protein